MPTVMPNPTSLAACAYISVLSKWPRRIIQKGRFWEYAMLKTHRCIQSPDMHLRWSILWNSWQLKPSTVFTRSSNLDVVQGSKYACEICNTLTIRYQSMKLYWESPVKNFYVYFTKKICNLSFFCSLQENFKNIKVQRPRYQGTKVQALSFMWVTAIPIAIILIKKYVTRKGSWKKGGVTISYHKYSGWERGERYSLLSVCVYVGI